MAVLSYYAHNKGDSLTLQKTRTKFSELWPETGGLDVWIESMTSGSRR
jgi:hypothetical protein